VARAARLEAGEIMAAIRAGDFYASTGVELASVERSERGLKLEVKPASSFKHRVHFIGRNGKVLKAVTENVAEYQLQPGDGYVRARVDASNGDQAWTQPVWAR